MHYACSRKNLEQPSVEWLFYEKSLDKLR
jgi:hypothetical protein